jgi:hypothetical protein
MGVTPSEEVPVGLLDKLLGRSPRAADTAAAEATGEAEDIGGDAVERVTEYAGDPEQRAEDVAADAAAAEDSAR